MDKAIGYGLLLILVGSLTIAGAMSLGRWLEQSFNDSAARLEQMR